MTEYIKQLTVCLVFCRGTPSLLRVSFGAKIDFGNHGGGRRGGRGGLVSVSVSNAISPRVKLLKKLWSCVGGEATHEKMVRVK